MTLYILFGLMVAIGYALYYATKAKKRRLKDTPSLEETNNTGCIIAAIALFVVLCIVVFMVFTFVL